MFLVLLTQSIKPKGTERWIHKFIIKNSNHAYSLVFEYIEAFYNSVMIHDNCNQMSSSKFRSTYEKIKNLVFK